MGNGVDNQDFAATKKLLTSWHVGILYEFFREQDITINELKMMQSSHINVLLRDYKMGVRIRFEYHFNSWRNKIGIPLKAVQLNHDMCCCNYNANVGNNSIENNNHLENKTTNSYVAIPNNSGAKRRRLTNNVEATDQTEFDENRALLSPQSVNSNTSLPNILNSNGIVNLMPMQMIGSPNEKNHNTDDEIEMESLPLNALSDLLSDSAYHTPPKFPSKTTPDKCPVDLNKILQMSGSRGRSIIKFYQEKNRLTNIHRSQLIQIVVDFFVENDYHLSLNMSHHLEWEILKMFPSEKLEYYRTEKRGKIYVKFSNTKRYKRERNNKVKTELELSAIRPRRSQQTNVNNENDNLAQEESDNMDAKTDEDWCPNAEPVIMVKEENFSGDEQNSE